MCFTHGAFSLLSLPPVVRPPVISELPDLRPRSLLPGVRTRLRASGAGSGGEGGGEEDEEGGGGAAAPRRGGSPPNARGRAGSGGAEASAVPPPLLPRGRADSGGGGGADIGVPLAPAPLPAKTAPLRSTVGVGALPVLALASRSVRAVACGNGLTLAAVATTWMSDNEALACVRCQNPFTFSRRRHHCRRCGGVFCAECSAQKLPLLQLGHIKAVRVCTACYERETSAPTTLQTPARG